MFILYDFIALIFTLFYLPVYLFKRKFHSGFMQRLGFLPEFPLPERPIWVHAVSVGEAMAARNLIKELKESFPQRPLLISTVTPTGNKVARTFIGETGRVIYLPLDFSFIVRKAVRMINPCLFLMVETEIWPNLISALHKNKVPVILVNGRISDRSFRGYKLIAPFLKNVFRKIRRFCVQTSADAGKLACLGAPEDRITVTGNMKFDAVDCLIFGAEVKKTRDELGLKERDKLFVAGSTHPGEEEAILEAYRRLLGEFSNLILLLAPRHPERSREVSGLVSRFGLRSVLASNLGAFVCSRCLFRPVFILDFIGELNKFYAAADIVFVGGSLVKKGGHNILEPAGFRKPVIFGPQMFNFSDIAELFLKDSAAILVNSENELFENIRELLINPSKEEEMASKAKELILNNKGATRKNLEVIKAVLV